MKVGNIKKLFNIEYIQKEAQNSSCREIFSSWKIQKAEVRKLVT